MKISIENWRNDTDRGNPGVIREENAPSVTLCTINLIRTDLALKSGLRGDTSN
jgi:hypothetical protein